MTHTDAQARQGLLDAIAAVIDDVAAALAALGEAYEGLDDVNADKLEEELFGPVQKAYGRAKRTYGDFAARHNLEARTFLPAIPGAPSNGVKGFIDSALGSISRAEGALVTLQDSMMPVEFGDPELRAGLGEVRTLLGDLPARARRFVSLLGR